MLAGQQGRPSLRRPLRARIRLESKVEFPERDRLPGDRGDLVGIATVADRCDLAFGTDRLQVGKLGGGHHAAHHPTARTAATGSAPGRVLQIGNHVRTGLRVRDSREGHPIARQERLWIGEEATQRVLAPDQVGRLQRVRISMKAFGRAGLATEHTGEAGPGAVHAWLERVAGCACPKRLRSGLRITSGASLAGRGENQNGDHQSASCSGP